MLCSKRHTFMVSHGRKLHESSELAKIGLIITSVLVDGHTTNVRFFSVIQHPLESEVPLHLVFDTVHLFKNFYNNCQRLR